MMIFHYINCRIKILNLKKCFRRINPSCLNIHLIKILTHALCFNWKLYNYENNNCYDDDDFLLY